MTISGYDRENRNVLRRFLMTAFMNEVIYEYYNQQPAKLIIIIIVLHMRRFAGERHLLPAKDVPC